MTDRSKAWSLPGALLALLFCLAFPPVWNAFFPQLVGDPITVRLTRPRTSDAPELPAGTRDARRIRFDARGDEQQLVSGVEVPEPGSYSVFGISANRRAQPLLLQVGDVVVTANAFYQKTGTMREGFERHRIANGVPFRAGANLVAVSGERAMYRTLVIELVREAPLDPPRFALLAAVAGALVWIRRAVVRRVHLPPAARLTVGVIATGTLLVAIPVAWYRISDGALVPLGYQDPVKTERLARLETRLASESHRRAAAEKFGVFLMGDSTHYWSLPPEHHLQAVVARELERLDPGGYEIYGMAGGALNAFDFYLLMHRVVREAPDLVVVPLSLRSFSEKWLHNETYRFHGMDHFLPPRSLLASRNLSVAGREISWLDWALRRADHAFFGGEAEHLLRGAKIYFQNEADRIARELDRTVLASWQPVPVALDLARMPDHPEWNTRIPADHPLFEAFRLLNEIAAREEIEILYYTERINAEAQREKGNEVRMHENFATVEAQIAGGPGIHYLDLVGRPFERDLFADEIDHLNPRGMAVLAGELAQAIDEIRRARSSGASAPGE